MWSRSIPAVTGALLDRFPVPILSVPAVAAAAARNRRLSGEHLTNLMRAVAREQKANEL